MQECLFNFPEDKYKKQQEKMMEMIVDELNTLAKGAEDKVHVKPLSNPNNKWFVRSALQKCIRRGDVSRALKCTGLLLGEDANYFWYSLAIIAMEDVGFGCPDACFYTTAIQGSVKVKKYIPVKASAEMLVTMMCEANKTRAFCELSVLAWLKGKAVNKSLYEKSEQELIDIVLNHDDSSVDAALEVYSALAIIRGLAKPPSALIEKRDKSKAAMQTIIEHMFDTLPYEHARASMMTFEKVPDDMNLAYYPIYKTLEALKIEEDWIPPCVEIKGLPSSSLDMHTSTGKKSLKAFYTSLKKDYPIIATIKPEDAVQAMGSVVFVEEGSKVDKRYISYNLVDLRERQNEAFMGYSGIAKADQAEFSKIVRAEIPRLNEKRIWATKLK